MRRWIVINEIELAEYLDEIRKEVCGRCVERPPGGPPCAPLGKQCGVELHLAQLIEAIHEIKSGSIVPYLEKNQQRVCDLCDHRTDYCMCPCPLKYLAVLIVQAVEAVDLRRQQQAHAVP
jgi:hypothetical protein